MIKNPLNSLCDDEENATEYYIKLLETDKEDLQIKLEIARACELPIACYKCTNHDCINNIYYSLNHKR
jgi:hypothetical protein